MGNVYRLRVGGGDVVERTAASSGTAASSATTYQATPMFADDFESYTVEGQAPDGSNSDFAWSTSLRAQVFSDSELSTDFTAYAGSRVLRFRFPGGAAGTDTSAQLNFTIARTDVDEVWMEYRIYYPDGTETWNGAYSSAKYWHRAGESPSNNKFSRLWGGSYGGGDGSNEVGPEYYPNATEGDEALRFKYAYPGTTGLGGFAITDIDPFVNDSYRGRWIQYRVHYRMSYNVQGSPIGASSYHYGDGIARMWWDGTKIYDFNYYGKYPAVPYYTDGYLFGYANSGFDASTYVFLDDFKIYRTDPGWGADDPATQIAPY